MPATRRELSAGDWHPETLHWWETWRSSPQGSVSMPTDWASLALVARLVELYWRRTTESREKAGLLAEIRRWESKFGATADRSRATAVGDPVSLPGEIVQFLSRASWRTGPPGVKRRGTCNHGPDARFSRRGGSRPRSGDSVSLLPQAREGLMRASWLKVLADPHPQATWVPISQPSSAADDPGA